MVDVLSPSIEVTTENWKTTTSWNFTTLTIVMINLEDRAKSIECFATKIEAIELLDSI